MISIINYGLGNLGSIKNMFNYLDIESEIVNDIKKIKKAKKIILPGVGAFDAAINKINKIDGLEDILNEKALNEKVPILGICLGMHLLTNKSEEGILKGFGWIDAETFRFNKSKSIKVPHMGWNSVDLNYSSDLTKDMLNESKFYFVHSYYVKVKEINREILTTKHGISFSSAIQKENIFGVQFHPEKSHKYGMKILENFSKI